MRPHRRLRPIFRLFFDAPLHWQALLLPLLLSGAINTAAQQPASTTMASADLPNAPSFAMEASDPFQATAGAAQGSAFVSGSVVDANGALLPGAHIALQSPGQPDHTTTSDAQGHFSIANLPAGRYHAAISAAGFQAEITPPFELQSGQHFELPASVLFIAIADTSINVSGNSEQVAETEINLQEQQRTLGIFPNFYTSYIWNAAPLTSKQKYKLTFHVLADPVSLIGFALVSEIETNNDTFPSWGRDAPSYGKRFGAAVGDSLFSRGFDSAVFPALFHQDPRYFYMGPAQPVRKRLIHALENGILCRGDNGKQQVNFSHIVGNASAGALSSVYHPASDSAGQLALDNTLLRLGFDALDATLREFVFDHITRHKPPYANGEPAGTPQP